jgi:putative DNA primase/helicase
MNDLVPYLRMVARVGVHNLLMVFDGKDSGQLTPFYHELLSDIIDFQPTLVILDTVADLFGGNENNRSQVRQFVQNCCARIARSIRLLSKLAPTNKVQGVYGAEDRNVL